MNPDCRTKLTMVPSGFVLLGDYVPEAIQEIRIIRHIISSATVSTDMRNRWHC